MSTRDKPTDTDSGSIRRVVARKLLAGLKPGEDAHAWSALQQMGRLLGMELVEKGSGKR